MADENNENTDNSNENGEEGSQKKGKFAFLGAITSKVKLPSIFKKLPLGKLSSMPRKKLIMLIGVLFAAIAALSLGIWVAMNTTSGTLDDPNEEEVEEVVQEAEPDIREEEFDLHGLELNNGGIVLEFDEMIVNITGRSASGKKTTRFLKVKLSLVVEDNGNFDEIESRKIYMRDSFQDYLRQVDEAELIGSMGLMNLKVNLLQRAKAIVGNKAPKEVFILDLIIQ